MKKNQHLWEQPKKHKKGIPQKKPRQGGIREQGPKSI